MNNLYKVVLLLNGALAKSPYAQDGQGISPEEIECLSDPEQCFGYLDDMEARVLGGNHNEAIAECRQLLTLEHHTQGALSDTYIAYCKEQGFDYDQSADELQASIYNADNYESDNLKRHYLWLEKFIELWDLTLELEY